MESGHMKPTQQLVPMQYQRTLEVSNFYTYIYASNLQGEIPFQNATPLV